jgi:hypothetical protein
MLDEVTAGLAAASLGLTTATNLFAGRMPETPNDCVALIEYGGLAPEPNLGAGATRYESPRFQVMVRSVDWATGRLLMQKIERYFASVVNTTIGGVRYLALTQIDKPFQDRDAANERWVWTINVQADKEPSPVA